MPPPPPTRHHRLIIPLLLAAITILAFWPAGDCQWVMLDDPVYVTSNHHVRNGFSWHDVGWACTTGHGANYHPLTWLTLMANAQVGGTDAWGYHVVNILLHAANAALLFLLLREMTASSWRSALVAALFAVHPLRVESVAWVSERKDVLCVCFGLLTLLAYVRFARRPRTGTYIWMLVFFGLGLLAKPMLVTLPALMLLLDYWPLRRIDLPAAVAPPFRAVGATEHPGMAQHNAAMPGFRRLLIEKLPLLALAAVSCVVTFLVQHRAGAMRTFADLSLATRLSNVPIAYVRYLGKLFWPANLVVEYPYPTAWPLWQIAGSVAILAAISMLAWRLARACPWLPVGWLWYLGTLVPVIGLVQVGNQAMADRYTYLPTIGLLIMLAWSIPESWFTLPRPRAALAGMAAAVVLTLSALTWHQIGYWHDGVTLFTHATTVGKSYPPQFKRGLSFVYNNLGVAYEQDNKIPESFAAFQDALALDPRSAHANLNIGSAMLRDGRFKEAMASFTRALEIKPNLEGAYNGQGAVLAQTGHIDEAVVLFDKAIAIDPDFSLAYRNKGAALASRGRFSESLDAFQHALLLDDNDPSLYYDIALVLVRAGKHEGAITFFRQAIALQPNYPDAENALAISLVSVGNLPEALEHFAIACRLDPTNTAYSANLARVRAMTSGGKAGQP